MPRIERAFIVIATLVSSILWVACSTAAPPAATIAAAAPTQAAAKPAASPVAASPVAASPAAIASPSPGAVAPRPADATLAISAPTAGQTVPAGSVQITVQYTGPQLVAAANATKLDDYHLHYFLDEDATPYLGTLTPVPMGNPRIVHTAALQVSFDGVTAGQHTVTVMLSGANHVSVAPPLSAQVQFTVQ